MCVRVCVCVCWGGDYNRLIQNLCFRFGFGLDLCVCVLQEGGPLPGPETGLLSNTLK